MSGEWDPRDSTGAQLFIGERVRVEGTGRFGVIDRFNMAQGTVEVDLDGTLGVSVPYYPGELTKGG